jgi:aromatic ring-cleaving dioxygenase
MTEAKDVGKITEYHAHIYYDPADADSRARAARLREWVEARFTVRMGRWHDVAVGPHPTAMYQIAFQPEIFPTLAPFIMLNTLHAVWMGEVLPLKTDVLREVDA